LQLAMSGFGKVGVLTEEFERGGRHGKGVGMWLQYSVFRRLDQ
jgi:hypothetical protein